MKSEVICTSIKNWFVNMTTISQLKGYFEKFNDFESRSAQFPDLFENLVSFFSNYKSHFSSNSGVVKLQWCEERMRLRTKFCNEIKSKI